MPDDILYSRSSRCSHRPVVQVGRAGCREIVIELIVAQAFTDERLKRHLRDHSDDQAPFWGASPCSITFGCVGSGDVARAGRRAHGYASINWRSPT